MADPIEGIVAAAGPLFSLVSGVALVWTYRRSSSGFLSLFWLWLGFLSTQIGFGYLLITPFATGGDTGFVVSSFADQWWAL